MQFRYTKIQAQGRSRHARSSQSSPEKHARAHAEESPPWPLVTRHTLSSERHQSSDWQLEQTKTQDTKSCRKHATILRSRKSSGASGYFGSGSLLTTRRTCCSSDPLSAPPGSSARGAYWPQGGLSPRLTIASLRRLAWVAESAARFTTYAANLVDTLRRLRSYGNREQLAHVLILVHMR